MAVRTLKTVPLNFKNLLIFDSVCVMCNGCVNIIVSLDTEKKFKFASIQSATAKRLLTEAGRDPEDLSTIVLLSSLSCDSADGRVKVSVLSDAILETVKQLGGGLWILGSLASLLPRFIRDGVYKFVARNRYSVFGTTEVCLIGKKYSDRFLE